MLNLRLPGALLVVCALTLFGTGCQKLKSRDNINKGVLAFKNQKYNDAALFFQQAADLDPESPNARVYLATSYMMQWIPGAESAANLEFVKKARDEFKRVLEKNASDTNSLASLASLAYNEAAALPPDEKTVKLEEAASWYNKVIAADANNRDAYYSLGAIAQKKFYPALMTARVNMNMKPEEPGPLKDKKVRDALKAQYGQILEEGIAKLQKSLEIDQEYDDAMAYMNLLVRERADLVDDKDAYKAQIEEADKWLQKALDTKKIKQERMEKKAGGGIVNESK